ncbi:MAG TPA: flagellar biosynthesis anti-sigma factor FlgM [Lachnospiraceae bacterium]|nr:flagellar biosynthesis anti-sigma factor FlgM [Lachnospiraceae bacterium]
MRIEAYNQVNQIYNTNKTAKNQKTTKNSFADQVHISSIGKDIQTLKQAVADSPDIREELTAPIKASINAGTYSVSAESFADKLLEKYNESDNLSF